jgi:hypothetical protein
MLLHSRHSKQPAPFSTLIVGLISLVLMLGKFTPFFIIFQVPPLSFFRVPSRFILTFVWSLVILSAYGFETIKNTKANKIILVSAIINLVVFAANYPAIVPSTTWLQQPETVQFLKKDVSWFRIYSLTPHEEWNSIFTKFGWSDANQYLFFRNSLDPNQNLIWGVPSVGLYTALSTRRSQEWNALIQKGITVNSETNEINLSSNSAKLLALGGVKYLISSSNKLKFPSPNFREAFRATGNPTFYVYTTEYFTPHVYLADSYFLVHNITELLQAVDNPEVKIPVLERNLGSEFSSTASSRICQQCGSATVEINDNHYIKIALHGITRKTLLVLTDSYYPGWKAWADSKPTTILPVDLNQRAVVIPPNTREVIFQYKPLEIF